MKKILLCGHYRQANTGWAKVAIDYILALDKKYDVICRPILLSEPEANIPERVKELEQRDSRGCDTILNITLPHHWVYDSRFKCCGVYFSETDNLPIEWTSRLNLMDEVWVCNEQMEQACKNSGVSSKLKVVLPPVNVRKYEQTYKTLPGLVQKLEGDFSFYVIGELNKRKNLSGILKAFHAEFDSNEPVQLVIKANKFGVPPQEIAGHIKKLSDEVKIGLKKYPKPEDYKKEIIIADKLSDEDLFGLHTTCDCLVNASFGEAYGQPIIDAMGLGKLVIANSVGGPKDYLVGYNEFDENEGFWQDYANGLTIKEQIREPAYGMIEGFPFLMTSEEVWYMPSTKELMDRMRAAYEIQSEIRSRICVNAINTVYNMNYSEFLKNIG